MSYLGHRVRKVMPNSIASEVNIESGDMLISINDTELIDILDYIEWMESEDLIVLIRKQNGEEWEIEIEKDPGEDLGIKFDYDLLDKQRSCQNKCAFCFIDQLPKGMRETVYYKDDDWRLSFLVGNFITLTNMDDSDIDRIIKKHISPLFISIHTTNPDLRSKMMNNRFAGDALRYLYRLAEAGININCQIVLCPGWNDGAELDRTISDLWELRPSVQNIGVVPVGLTRYRNGLEQLKGFDPMSATKAIEQIDCWQNTCREESGCGFVYAADEFYIYADKKLPNCEYYDGFEMLEDGIGMMVQFKKEFKDAIDSKQVVAAGNKIAKYKMITIVTGKSAYNFISEIAKEMEHKLKVKVQVIPVENNFFGESITVAGLLTGKDIISTLKGKNLGDKVLIPSSMLKAGEDIFLDDVTLLEMENELGLGVIVVSVHGYDLVDAVTDSHSLI